MEEKIIDVDIEYNDKDIKTAILELTYKVLWIIVICIGLFIIISIYSGIKSGFTLRVNVLLGIYVVVLCLFLYFYLLGPISGYSKYYRTIRVSSFEFSLNNILIKRNLSESSCKWELFTKVFETKKNFLFKDINKFMTIIPKRCFKTDKDIQDFRDLLKTIKKTDFRFYGV